MKTIRKPRLVDLLNLQLCVNNGASDLPLRGPNIEDWARYSMVAEDPGKNIIAYVSAYVGYDDIWTNRVCGHVNKFAISPDYKDFDVDILTIEEILKAEKNEEGFVVKRMKVDRCGKCSWNIPKRFLSAARAFSKLKKKKEDK